MLRRPPRGTLFPYTTLFRSIGAPAMIAVDDFRFVADWLLLGTAALTVLVSFDYLERSEEHTSELQSHSDLVCRLLLEKKNAQPGLPPLPSFHNTATARSPFT